MILADGTETGQLKATAPKWTSAHLNANKASLDVGAWALRECHVQVKAGSPRI